MKKMIVWLVVSVLLTSVLVSCKNEGEKSDPHDGVASFFRKIAREVTEDGWVYTFEYEDLKDENADDSDIIKYSFYGINIRYQFNDDYIQVHEQIIGDQTYTTVIVPSCMIAGNGPSAESRDMALINNVILDQSLSVEELLALNPDDYKFESINKDIFFRLMREALTGEEHKENTDLTYWDRASWAMMTEPQYIDNYRFQIGYVQGCGCIDELYIDVRYQTGDGYKDFVQLSDLIAAGDATEEQQQVFEMIQIVVKDIKEQENFIASADIYKNKTIGEIEFSRLFAFLQNIHSNQYNQYIADQYSEVFEGIIDKSEIEEDVGS